MIPVEPAVQSEAVGLLQMDHTTSSIEPHVIADPTWLVGALRSGGIGLWRWDIETDRVTRTENSYQFMGVNRDEFGQGVNGFLASIHLEDRERCAEVVQRALASGTDYRIEFRMPQEDGSEKWIEGVGQIIRDEDGKAKAIEGAIYDITARIAAEQEINKTHADYQRIVSAAGLVVYHHDIPGDEYRLANLSVLEEIIGVPYQGSHLQFWKSVTLLESRPMGDLAGLTQHEAVQKFRRGGTDVWRAEYKIQRQDGQLRWIYDFSYAIRNAAGEVVGSFGILQDLTELRRITETISKIVSRTAATGETYLQQLVFALSEALEVRFAFIGEFVDGEQRAARMVASAEYGKPIENVAYALKGTPCEKVYEEGICFFREDVQTLFPDDVMLQEVGAHAYLGAPLKSSTGEPMGLIVVLHDGPINETLNPRNTLQLFAAHAAAEIERRHVEDALKESEDFYRSLVTVQSEGIVVQDENDRILACNPSAQRLLRASEAELLGKTAFDPLFRLVNLNGKPWDPTQAPSVLAVKTGEPQRDKTYGLKWEDGSVTWISVDAVPVEKTSGVKRRHVVVSFTDITARLNAESELKRVNSNLEALVSERTQDLQRANRELESFAYSVSHDLRQPLRSIDGFSRILEMDYGDLLDDEAKGHIDTIRAATRRMSQLIDDLLRLSRLLSHDFIPKTVDLSQLARDVFDTLIADGTAQITIEPELTAVGDESLLRAVMDNLLQNAIKFSARVEQPQIVVGREGDAFYVRDNGVGFDMKYSNKLFEPFQRLHGRDEFEGTGIGLATVHRIIERHNGKVWADSKVGEGTSLFFSLGED